MLLSWLYVTVLACVAWAEHVIELTDETFKQEVGSQDVILIEFFAPWCGHCKKLAPEYEKAAKKLKKNDPPIVLASVDCTIYKPVCEKYGVSGFPTLKIFRKGEMSADYQGPRQAEGIIKYMRGQVGPSSRELNTVAEMDKFINNEDHSIIGFFETDTRLKDSFMKVADTERDRYRFAHTASPDILEKYQMNDDIAMFHPKRLHNKFEDHMLKYTGNYDTEKIKRFLEGDMQGLCGHRTGDNAANFERPFIIVYYKVDYVRDPKGTNYWRNRVLKVADQFEKDKVKIKFAISNKEDFDQELEEHGLGDRKDEAKPLVAAQNEDGEKFAMEDEFSMPSLEEFAKDLLAGKLTPYMKSEPIPESNNDLVKVAVGLNFNQIVEKDKDVLIEFYAPWCGHCKKLAPILDELAEMLEKEKDILIVKMDASANDVPGKYQVQGFPTIYWKPKGKNPEPYTGGRDLDDFVKFIAEKATKPLKGYARDGSKQKKSKKDEV